MGQAYDLLTAVAETLLDAVLIRAVGLGDGNFSALNGNNVVPAVSCIKDKLLCLMQIHGYHCILAADLCFGHRCVIGRHQNEHQTQRKKHTDQHDPVFVFQRNHLPFILPGFLLKSITKMRKKRKKNSENVLDFLKSR